MKKNYKATLFHPEGDYVTDFDGSETIQDVWDKVADMGSKWVFYPLVFVTTEKRIADTPIGLQWMRNRDIKTVQRFFKSTWSNRKDEVCKYINNGWPLADIYG